jgi:hypothetical protein
LAYAPIANMGEHVARRIKLIEVDAESLRLKSNLEKVIAAAIIFVMPPPLLSCCFGMVNNFVESESGPIRV